jgi:hypothetical protein
MGIPFVDPTTTTNLESLDFGEILSMDGRAHPLDANTPIKLLPSLSSFSSTADASDPVTKPPQQGGVPNPGSGPLSTPVDGTGLVAMNPVTGAVSSLGPKTSHGWARLAVAVVGIIIIAIVLVKLT